MKNPLAAVALLMGLMICFAVVVCVGQILHGELLTGGYIIAFLAFAAWLYRRNTGH